MIDTNNDGLANFGVAVGNSGLVVVYNGSTWTSSTISVENLFGVKVFSPNDAWVVGANGTRLHYNGLSWTSITPGVSNTQILRSISGI
jgi:photosystem II stability/assembly factor-like uncharacterized protein